MASLFKKIRLFPHFIYIKRTGIQACFRASQPNRYIQIHYLRLDSYNNSQWGMVKMGVCLLLGYQSVHRYDNGGSIGSKEL